MHVKYMRKRDREMKITRMQKLLATILAVALSLTMLPAQVMAAELSSTDQREQNTLQADPRLMQGESGAATITDSDKDVDAEILGEIPSGRDEYQKEFLLSNGQRLLVLYPTPVHYEENGQWEEIDNTLLPVSEDEISVYQNTAGPWDVTFPAKIDNQKFISVQQDGHSISFRFDGRMERTESVALYAEDENDSEIAELPEEVSDALELPENEQALVLPTQEADVSVSTVDVNTAGDAAQQQIRPEGMHAIAEYTNLFANTDLKYDLTAGRLKESIIIQQPEDALLGYRYHLEASGLTLTLQEDRSILAYAAGAAEGDRPVYYMPAPFLLDDEQAYSTDVQVQLLEVDGGYDLYYLLPVEWMSDSNRAYPVVLDPVLQPVSNTYTIRDQSVFEKDQFSPFWGMVECGYNPRHYRERIFMKFKNLPKLTSADVIVSASVSMLKSGTDEPIVIEAHQVNGDWDSEDITWTNQPSHNSNVEDYQTVDQGEKWYTWDITHIAQTWYEDNKNTGVMFRMQDWVESGKNGEHWEQFYSSDYSPTYAPVLTIAYINNCGLESFWDYTTQSAGTAGSGQINNYTGNLVWTTNSFGFSGNRMPVSISHIYNANDKDSNSYGIGYGWRTNYNQKVYQFTQDTSYYVWEDEDGTRHYFKYKSSGTYEDELIKGLILTTTGSGDTKYCLTDKSGNKSYFNASGYLTKITNNQATKSSITISYSSGKISKITDGVGRVYTFTYTSGLLSKIAFMGTGSSELASESFTYSSGNLTGIRSTVSISADLAYTSNHLLNKVTDASGYRLQYTYNTTGASQPNRIIRVMEQDGSTTGGTLDIEYSHNQTTFKDHNGNREIHQFNNYGSTMSIQDGEGHAQFYRYASSTNAQKASQLTLSSKLQNTVVNLARNGSFEWEAYWTGDSGNASTGKWEYTKESTYLEWEALKIQRTAGGTPYSVRATDDAVCAIQPGKTYTLSAYVRTTGMSGTGDGAQLLLKLKSSGATVASSRSISSNSNWTRLEVTYTHPENATSDSLVVHLSNRSVGTAYFDCVQLEESANASRYNIMENGDFRTGKWDTWSVFGWRFGDDCTSSETKVTAPGSAAAPQMDRSSMRFVGGTSLNKQAYQNILISGSAGDVYALGCWAKGDSVPLTSGTSRRFGIVLRFYYSDGTEGEEIASFNPDCNSQNDWQYLSLRAVAKKAYTSMRILMVYESNANVVYYDGIQLYKEEFGHSYVYDADGNVISVMDLQKQTTTYEYKNNDLVKMILPSGAKQTYTYDSYHNVLSATSPEGVVSNFTYDAYGNNTKVTLGSGAKKISAAATYTANGDQLASITDALGNTTSYGYDAQTGLLNWVQAPGETESTRTNYSYDDQMHTSGVSQNGAQVSYTYSGELVKSISTASGTEYLFDYGTFDTLSSVKIGQRTLVNHTYSKDANHWLTRSDYGNGDYVTYDYDSFGQLIGTGYEDNADAVSYAYDNNGNLGLRLDNLSGRSTKYFYDFQDRLMRYEETGDGYSNTVQWGYDDKNNLSSQTQILNGTTYTSKYAYDEDNRITKTTEGQASASYTYDGYGRMTGVQTKSGNNSITETAITYMDRNTSLSSDRVKTWNNGKATYTYTYDAKGNILSFNGDGQEFEYRYDDYGRLISAEDYPGGYVWTYTYDVGGNITKRGLTDYYNGSRPYSTLATYSYDDAEWPDLLTAFNGKPITYDTLGNPLTDGTWTYTWQHGRQLQGMNKTGTDISFAYNADGNRISKTVDGTTYNYTYLGGQLVEMTWDNNKMHFNYNSIGPMSVIYNGTEYFYLMNAQGDITGIIDATGNQVVSYIYDPWGAPVSTKGTLASTLGTANPLRYRAYIYDTETKLYYLNSRYYNPVWGRFINTDGYISTNAFTSNETNGFVYCKNNPTNYFDVLGDYPLRNKNVLMTDTGSTSYETKARIAVSDAKREGAFDVVVAAPKVSLPIFSPKKKEISTSAEISLSKTVLPLGKHFELKIDMFCADAELYTDAKKNIGFGGGAYLAKISIAYIAPEGVSVEAGINFGVGKRGLFKNGRADLSVSRGFGFDLGIIWDPVTVTG